MSLKEKLIIRFIDELISYLKKDTANLEKLDKIACKVSKHIPLTDDENSFMEMVIPSELSKTFWSAAKNASSEKEFLDAYKKGTR